MTEETTDDFDWGQLGPAWWRDVGKQLGASERQLRFAVAKYRGCSNTESARQAGYTSADPAGLRSTGYRLARSNITERLLAFAAAEASDEGFDGASIALKDAGYSHRWRAAPTPASAYAPSNSYRSLTNWIAPRGRRKSLVQRTLRLNFCSAFPTMAP